jgi:hypothetical protein
MPEYSVADDAFWEFGLISQGYPYLMQLLGYYAVERAAERLVAGRAPIGVEHVHEVKQVALAAYRENVLVPILSELSSSLGDYLRAMCEVSDEHGRVSTGAVARHLGKGQSQVSSYRQRLIDRRLIEPDGQGYARFTLPHVAAYYRGASASLEQKRPDQQWNRRL